jgi:dTDP-L-rhamnose 4-epimerase
VSTVAQTLISKLGQCVDVNVTGNYRLGDIRHNFADLTHIKNKLGFNPQFNFESGIAAFANWVLCSSYSHNAALL